MIRRQVFNLDTDELIEDVVVQPDFREEDYQYAIASASNEGREIVTDSVLIDSVSWPDRQHQDDAHAPPHEA